MPAPHRIDVHTHYFGGTVADRLRGVVHPGGFRISAEWTVENAVAFMDRHGIATQILSFPTPLTDASPGGRAESEAFARRLNEEYAGLVRDHPRRFGAFAALPMTTPDRALAELEYALDELGLDGVLVPSNAAGHYLGRAFYEPVLAELERRGVPGFVHPADCPHIDVLGLGRPSSIVEYPFDTARTITDALYAGTFQRHPGLTLIVAHCGGALPTLGWRIAEHTTMGRGPGSAEIDPDHVRDVLARLHYETALAGSRHSLLPTLEVTTADHILLGTDWPAAPERTVDHNLANLAAFGFSESELAGIEHDNAAKLFRRFAG